MTLKILTNHPVEGQVLGVIAKVLGRVLEKPFDKISLLITRLGVV